MQLANITRWKHEERVPVTQALLLCQLLGIDVPLLSATLDEFQAGIADRFHPDTGRRWKALSSQALSAIEAFRLLREGMVLASRPSLRGLGFPGPQRPSPLSRLPRLVVGDRVRLALNLKVLPAKAHEWTGLYAVVLAEDPEGMACLCPSERAPVLVESEGLLWLPAPGQPALQVGEPPGRHVVWALLFERSLDEEVEAALLAGRLAWALDTAAATLVDGGVRHLILKNEFLVS